MAEIKQKLERIFEALETLHESIEIFNECVQKAKNTHIQKDERFSLTARDSMIQRFEYCTDLLWKLLGTYLKEKGAVELSIYTPAYVIRAAVGAKIITELQGMDYLKMVKSRNKTFHIYHQEIALEIADHIPGYYQLMIDVANRIQELLV